MENLDMANLSGYEQMLLEMFKDPPDPNEPLPIINRRGTILGLAISFLIAAWIAVLLRLYVRIRVVREPGWDDAAVALAAVIDFIAIVFLCLSVDHGGLGHHQLYQPIGEVKIFLHHFYIALAIYVSNTALVKISLLLQFLRIFRAGYMRIICLTLLGLVSLWGLAFSIIAWFPCFPVRGYWDREIEAHCYGFGFGYDVDEFVNTFRAHSASNMCFDLAIFFTPLILFGRPNLKVKSLLCMGGIFALGGVCVATSVWRLYAILENRAGTYPYYDFTWHTPLMIVLSCLEIDLAIMCASMPIFWPMIEKGLAAIFVQYEVNVTEERVHEEYGLAYELEHSKSQEDGSIRSTSGTSVEELTKNDKDEEAPKFSVGVDPLSEEVVGGYKTVVQTGPKQKWVI